MGSGLVAAVKAAVARAAEAMEEAVTAAAAREAAARAAVGSVAAVRCGGGDESGGLAWSGRGALECDAQPRHGLQASEASAGRRTECREAGASAAEALADGTPERRAALAPPGVRRGTCRT